MTARSWLVALTIAVAACGATSPANPDAGAGADAASPDPAAGAYTGALVSADGTQAIVELQIGAAARARPVGTLPVTGHATFVGALGRVTVDGTYDPDARTLMATITGTGFTITATFDGTTLSGTLNGGAPINLVPGPAAAVQAYCGTFLSSDQRLAGAWTLLASPSAGLAGGAFAATGTTTPFGGVIAGTIDGAGTLALTLSGSGSATGTATGTSAMGHWTGASTSGTFMGTSAACPVAPTGTVTGVTVTANPPTVASGGTSALTATVTGTGTFSTAVAWQIFDGGGAITGLGTTVSYTAPTVTTATVAHVKAISAADGAIVGEVAITITPAGTGPLVGVHRTLAVGGYNSFVAVKADHTVVTWGNDMFGQLGNGPPAADSATPVAVLGLTNVIAVAAGQFHVLALKDDGTVWGWGLNQSGELGGVATTDTPKQLTSLAGQHIIAIAAGDSFSLAVSDAGQVFAFGANDGGQCGPGAAQVTLPQQAGITNAVQVTAGHAHLLALKQGVPPNRSVLTMGANSSGELGNGGTTGQATPITLPGSTALDIAAGYDHSAAIIDGKLYVWGNVQALGMNAVGGQTTPLAIAGLSNPRAVAAGYETTFVMLLNGTVWSFGSDQQNALGVNMANQFVATPTQLPGLSNVTAVAANALVGAALTTTGEVYTWGAGQTATPALAVTGIALPQ
jgi:alpha-tubulin suppressor-like RCC1 family protein